MSAQAQQPSAGARSLLIVYSRPKRGKTTAFVRACSGGLLIGQRRAIADVAWSGSRIPESALWIDDAVVDVPSLVARLQWVLTSEGLKAVGPRRVIYIDDLTLLCDRSMPGWAAQDTRNKYHAFNRLQEYLLLLAGAADALGRHGIMVCVSMHEHPPETKEATVGGQKVTIFYRGSPEIPSRPQLDFLPSWCDRIARLEQDETYPDPWWSLVFQCDPQDGQWTTGDRVNQIRNGDPANLRELLLLDGVIFPRPTGLEGLDELAEDVAVALVSGKGFGLSDTQALVPEVLARWGPRLGIGKDSRADAWFQWGFQDGVARAALRRSRALGVLGRMRKAGGGTGAPPPPVGGS